MMQPQERQRLQDELVEMRQRVAQLQARLEKMASEEQHEMIDDLDEHFDAVETRFRGLREFLKSIFSPDDSASSRS